MAKPMPLSSLLSRKAGQGHFRTLRFFRFFLSSAFPYTWLVQNQFVNLSLVSISIIIGIFFIGIRILFGYLPDHFGSESAKWGGTE